MHLSADRSSATVVSIPRDSMTPAPPNCSATAPKGEWALRQWNQNYAIGGPGCLIRTLEGNTGVFIDHYAVVDFRGFKQMVDALGGVEVCTPEAIDDANTHLQLAAGRHTLDGRQALQYVRVRKSVGDGSDLQRIERQQAFLSSVIQKATSTQLLFEPTKLYAFLNAATKSLTTDPEFGVGTMRDLATSVKGIGLDKIQFVTVPHEPYVPDPNRVQWKGSAEQIWSALRADRPVGAEPRSPRDAVTAATRRSPSPPPTSRSAWSTPRVSGLARQAPRPRSRCRASPGSPPRNGARPHRGVVEYSGGHAEDARTVAAAFPGAVVEKTAGPGCDRAGHPRAGAPEVVEVPNRLGSAPLPSPSVSSARRPPSRSRPARPTPTSAPDRPGGSAAACPLRLRARAPDDDRSSTSPSGARIRQASLRSSSRRSATTQSMPSAAPGAAGCSPGVVKKASRIAEGAAPAARRRSRRRAGRRSVRDLSRAPRSPLGRGPDEHVPADEEAEPVAGHLDDLR